MSSAEAFQNTSTGSAGGRRLASPVLLTDRYELTMIQAALAAGTAHRDCVFELFTRRLPAGRRYGVLAGTGRFLAELLDFRFADADLVFLESEQVVDAATLNYLADYRFTGDIDGYAEGEIFFPNSPLLTVRASFAEGVILETLALSILNYDSAVAAAASRMTNAAGGRPCLEMGSRRANEDGAVAAARAAVIAGFAATSNLAAGALYGVDTVGTAAHSFTLLHDSERAAFEAQVAALGSDTTLLVDTYDVSTGVATAVEVAGPELGAVRIDSGDLSAQAFTVRQQLDSLGATDTKIVVTSDLDEYAIAALAAAPVDVYGVGTSVVTGSGAPTCSMVYKLVERRGADGNWESVSKAATHKTSRGGLKVGARQLDAQGQAVAEQIITGEFEAVRAWQPEADSQRALQVPLVRAGVVDERYVGAAGLALARERYRASIAELPPTALRLSRGDAALATQVVEL